MLCNMAFYFRRLWCREFSYFVRFTFLVMMVYDRESGNGRVLAGYAIYEERSDSMEECLTRYQMVAVSSLSETIELCL